MDTRERFIKAVRDAGATAPHGVWLVVLPASGTVRRVTGRIFALDVGGESGVAPFVLLDSGEPMTFDPRALIVCNDTLAPVWQPRDHAHHSHPMAGKWFRKNPDVFKPTTPSGVSPL